MIPMKTLTSILAFFVLALSAIFFAGAADSAAKVAAPQESGQLVYADFEKMQGNRPVSARGGYMQLYGGQQNPRTPATFKRNERGNPPEMVHFKTDDPNKACKFSYTIPS